MRRQSAEFDSWHDARYQNRVTITKTDRVRLDGRVSVFVSSQQRSSAQAVRASKVTGGVERVTHKFLDGNWYRVSLQMSTPTDGVRAH